MPAVTFVLKNEGGLVDNAEDAGGITNFGVSLAFYKKKIKIDADKNDIRHLSAATAERIYFEYFWQRLPFDDINSQEIATRLFDLTVNTGQAHAIAMIQRAINNVNPSEHILVDSQFGVKTLTAINTLDEHKLYNALICEASKYYHDIAKHGNNQVFLKGWLHRLESPMI